MDSLKPPFDVIVWHPYTARNQRELTIEVGQKITVQETEERCAWFGTKVEGRTVWFPASYTRYADTNEIVQAPTATTVITRTKTETSKESEQNSIKRSKSVSQKNKSKQPGTSQVTEAITSPISIPPPTQTPPPSSTTQTLHNTTSVENPRTVDDVIQREEEHLQSNNAESNEKPPGFEESQVDKSNKDKKQRIMTIKEIVSTEIDYVRDIKILVNMSKILSEKKLLPPDVMANIFSNVTTLYGVNMSICDEIEEEKKKINQSSDGEDEEDILIRLPLGKIYERLAPFLKMYLQYCENHDNALIVLAKQKKKNKQLDQWINQQAETQDCKGLFLKDYLIKPIQRLCKYPLFFQNLLNLTPEDDSDYPYLNNCLEKINAIVRDINEIRDNNVNFLSLYMYEERLQDYDGTLLSRQRKFIREGTLYIQEDKKSRITHMRKSDALERVLLVFNDKIVICKKNFSLGQSKNQLKFSSEFDTAFLRVIDNYKEHPDYEISFLLETHTDDKKAHMVFCENTKEKQTWIKLLTETVKAAKSSFMRKEDNTEPRIEFSNLDPNTITEKEVRAIVSLLLGSKGIALKNRKVKHKTYKNCFLGKDLVTWLCDNKIAEDRKKAEQISEKFIEFKYLKHAAEENGHFKDDASSPYRFDSISMDRDKGLRNKSPFFRPITSQGRIGDVVETINSDETQKKDDGVSNT